MFCHPFRQLPDLSWQQCGGNCRYCRYRSLIFGYCLIFCEKYNLPSSLHYAVTRRRRIVGNLLANLRTSGFVSLRRDKHLLKKYTLPRRSLCGAGSFRFALIYLRPCLTLHPPTAIKPFYCLTNYPFRGIFQYNKMDIASDNIKVSQNSGHY